MRLAPLALIAVLAAAPAWAVDLGDAPMATAGAVPADEAPVVPQPVSPAPEPALTTAEQIDEFLRNSPARDVASGDDIRRNRKVHGEVAAAVGSHGYRALYARADIPVGENGLLSVAVAQSEGGRFGGFAPYGYGGYGYGGYGIAPLAPGFAPRDIQRCGLETMTEPRPLDRLGGPNGRCLEGR